MERVIILYLVMLGIKSCSPQQQTVPSVYKNAESVVFSNRDGLVYADNQLFSGYQIRFFSTGDTLSVIGFINGKEEGEACKWYENKQLKEVRLYANGKKEGEHKGWWPSGAQKFCYHYQADVYEGNIKEWYESGQLYRNCNYVNGYENGLQQTWFSDGILQSNYEARNGRNYGNIGTKHCKSIYKKKIVASTIDN